LTKRAPTYNRSSTLSVLRQRHRHRRTLASAFALTSSSATRGSKKTRKIGSHRQHPLRVGHLSAGPGAPGRHLRVLVTSGFPSELVSTPFSEQASRAGLDTYVWRGRTVLPVFNLRNQSKPSLSFLRHQCHHPTTNCDGSPSRPQAFDVCASRRAPSGHSA
jgi:hypothetical protein